MINFLGLLIRNIQEEKKQIKILKEKNHQTYVVLTYIIHIHMEYGILTRDYSNTFYSLAS